MVDSSKNNYGSSNDSISWLTIKPEEVTFDYNLQANKSIITNLDLKNKSKTYIAYKIKTTNPKIYLVKPSLGYLAPNESISIDITVVFSALPSVSVITNDKFLLMCAEAQNSAEMLDKFWKNVSSTQTQQMKLKVNLLNCNTENSALKESNNDNKFKNERNEGERSLPIFKSTIENDLIKTTNLRENSYKPQPEFQKNLAGSNNNINVSDQSDKNKFENDYQKKYEEILSKVDEQEKLLNKLNQDRSRLVKELSQYKNTTFKHSNVGEKDTQFGFQLWHVLLAAAISLLVGALLSSK